MTVVHKCKIKTTKDTNFSTKTISFPIYKEERNMKVEKIRINFFLISKLSIQKYFVHFFKNYIQFDKFIKMFTFYLILINFTIINS